MVTAKIHLCRLWSICLHNIYLETVLFGIPAETIKMTSLHVLNNKLLPLSCSTRMLVICANLSSHTSFIIVTCINYATIWYPVNNNSNARQHIRLSSISLFSEYKNITITFDSCYKLIAVMHYPVSAACRPQHSYHVILMYPEILFNLKAYWTLSTSPHLACFL